MVYYYPQTFSFVIHLKRRVEIIGISRYNGMQIFQLPADLTVCKRPGTSYQIEIHSAVFNHLVLITLFSFIMKLAETYYNNYYKSMKFGNKVNYISEEI